MQWFPTLLKHILCRAVRRHYSQTKFPLLGLLEAVCKCVHILCCVYVEAWQKNQAAVIHSISDNKSTKRRVGLVARRVEMVRITGSKKISHDAIFEWWYTAQFLSKEVWNLNGIRERWKRKEWRHSLSGSVSSIAKHAHHSTHWDRVVIEAWRN